MRHEMINDYNFQRDEEMLLLTLEGLDKNNTGWFNNLVGYVISHGNGGSVKGWAYEDAFYQEFYEVFKDDVIKHPDTKPDSDITIKTPVNDLDVQAKCYKTGSTSGIQLATLSNTNLCVRCEECILPDGDFDGQRFSEIIREYKLPVDLLTTLDYTTKKATLYAFDFAPLFRKVTRCSKTKDGISFYAPSKNGRKKVAFRIKYPKKAVDSFNRGVWINDWFLEENVCPVMRIDFPKTKNLYKAFIAA